MQDWRELLCDWSRRISTILARRVSWEWCATLAVISLSVSLFLRITELSRLAEIGEFISGFASILAFMWLVIGLRSQASDLRLQREELALQRIAMERLAAESTNATKINSLTQIETLLERAVKKFQREFPEWGQPKDVLDSWMLGMKNWKSILESTNAEQVSSLFSEWIKIDGAARFYLASIAIAMKLFMEHHLRIEFDQSVSDEVLVSSNWEACNSAPIIAEHIGVAQAIAKLFQQNSNATRSIQYAGVVALAKIAGYDLNEDGKFAELHRDLINRGAVVPAIAIGM